jgi:hypothetical protein
MNPVSQQIYVIRATALFGHMFCSFLAHVVWCLIRSCQLGAHPNATDWIYPETFSSAFERACIFFFLPLRITLLTRPNPLSITIRWLEVTAIV